MNTQRPWRWFLTLESWVHRVRVLWVKLIRQKPAIVAYLGYGSQRQIRVLARAVYTGKRERSNPNLRIRGWRSFLAVPYRGAEITITVGGQQFKALCDNGGFVDQTLPVRLEPGWQSVALSLPNGAHTEALVQIIADDIQFGIVSDIDDTIMVTSLAQPLLALWNTFILEEDARDAVSGMPVLYERLRQRYPDAPFIYLSTGAWNVLPTHQRFMARNMFPIGPMLLTDWGPSHERWFRSGKEHKRQNLRQILQDFPNIRWLLIGDDGEHDPERYHEIAAQYPERVQAIAIRKLNTDKVQWEQSLPDTASPLPQVQPQGPADPLVVWIFGHDGSALSTQLEALNIL